MTLLDSLHAQGFDRSWRTTQDSPTDTGYRVACSGCEAVIVKGIATHRLNCPNRRHTHKPSTTRLDPTGQMRLEAIGVLEAAHNLRATRASLIRAAILHYGWVGPLISGVEQEHWPANLKDTLRTNAREIGKATDDALVIWRKSGRRLTTLYPLLPQYRHDGSRY